MAKLSPKDIRIRFDKDGLPFAKDILPHHPESTISVVGKRYVLALHDLAEAAADKGLEVNIDTKTEFDYRPGTNLNLVYDYQAWKIVRVRLKPTKIQRVVLDEIYLSVGLEILHHSSSKKYDVAIIDEIVDRTGKHPHALNAPQLPGSWLYHKICHHSNIREHVINLDPNQALLEAAVISATHTRGWTFSYLLLGRPLCRHCKTWMDPEVYDSDSYTFCPCCRQAVCKECSINGGDYHPDLKQLRVCSERCAKATVQEIEYSAKAREVVKEGGNPFDLDHLYR